MNTSRFLFSGITLLVIFILSITVNSFGYSSNYDISVTRQMPSSAIAGETITVEISIDIGTGISDLIRGFYLSDEVPEDLMVESSSIVATLNSTEVTNIMQEVETAGAIYPGAAPYRIILETPPDFNEGNYLTGGDELTVSYDVTVPNDATAGTVYTFPGYSWVGRLMNNPREDMFGHEDEPEATLEVISDTTTTSSVITSTTTSVQTTPSSSSSTTSTATGSSTSTTTIGGNITTTTPVNVTTSIVPEEYVVSFSPASISIDSNQTITLNAQTTLYGQEVQGCVYEWKIVLPTSTIGSSVDQGIFKAGLNLTSSTVIEYVSVTDVAHNNATATATISVKPEILQGTIAGIFPKQLFRSRWFPVFYLMFIIGNETRFDPSSKISFNQEEDIVSLGQIEFENLLITYIKLDPSVQSGMVDVIVTTGKGDEQHSVVAKDAININLFGF